MSAVPNDTLKTVAAQVGGMLKKMVDSLD